MSHVPQLRRSDNLKYRYMKKEKQSAHAVAALECGSFNEQKFLTGKFLIIEFHQKIFSALFITIQYIIKNKQNSSDFHVAI